MFAELNSVISKFILKEKDYLIDYPIYDIELIFVELPKFKKQLSKLETIVDKWLYFLNNARSLQEIPVNMDDIPEIKKAFNIANQANLSLDELEDQEKREIFIQDQKGAITKALFQGREEGKQEKTYEIARKMLGLVDDLTICEFTGLSPDELGNVKSSNQGK